MRGTEWRHPPCLQVERGQRLAGTCSTPVALRQCAQLLQAVRNSGRKAVLATDVGGDDLVDGRLHLIRPVEAWSMASMQQPC